MKMIECQSTTDISAISTIRLVWRQILRNLMFHERILLRRVCRDWRDIVDSFVISRLHVVIGHSVEKSLSRFDLFPLYSLPYSRFLPHDDITEPRYVHRHSPKRPLLSEIVHYDTARGGKDGAFRLPFADQLESIVFDFTSHYSRKSRYWPNKFDLNSYPAAVSLEFRNHGRYRYDRHSNFMSVSVDGYFNGCNLPNLRRLVSYGCIIENVLDHCPALQVLKLDDHMLPKFFAELNAAHRNRIPISIKKLHLAIDTYQHHYEEHFPRDLGRLVALDKFTLRITPQSLNTVFAKMLFHLIPRTSIRLMVRDHEWTAELLEQARKLFVHLQQQLMRNPFRVTVNGLLITADTRYPTFQQHMTNFVATIVNPFPAQIDGPSADRFRCSEYFKRLEIDRSYQFFRARPFNWPFLRKLEITQPVTRAFLAKLPQAVPLLQHFTLLGGFNLNPIVFEDYVYDLRFILDFKQLSYVKLANFKPADENVLKRIVLELPLLRTMLVQFNLDTQFFCELYKLMGDKADRNRSSKYKIEIGQRNIDKNLKLHHRMLSRFGPIDSYLHQLHSYYKYY
jgi:hypothetical protein